MGIPTKLYIADVTALENEEIYRTACRLVKKERFQKAQRYRLPGDRNLSLGAGLLLRHGLKSCGLRYEDVTFAKGKSGKPYGVDLPGVCFNLSHSGSIVVCAVSSMEIGCDVEKIEKAQPALAKRFFSPEEYESIEGKTKGERDSLFFRLWTLKESYVKMIGRGLSLPLDSFCIRFNGDTIAVKGQKEQTGCYFREFFIDGDYACALCGMAPDIRVPGIIIPEYVDLTDLT